MFSLRFEELPYTWASDEMHDRSASWGYNQTPIRNVRERERRRQTGRQTEKGREILNAIVLTEMCKLQQ